MDASKLLETMVVGRSSYFTLLIFFFFLSFFLFRARSLSLSPSEGVFVS